MKSTVKIFVIFLSCISCVPLINAQGAARRTAPRRTTVNGGTYGTETYPTVTEASTLFTRPLPAEPAAVTVAIPSFNFNPSSGVDSTAVSPGRVGAVGGVVPGVQGVVAVVPGAGALAAPVTVRRTTIYGQTIPTRIIPTMPPTEEDGQDVPGETGNGNHVPVVGLCEEVEELLRPGTTEQECFVADPVTLRYWQPYRALRHIKCKNG